MRTKRFVFPWQKQHVLVCPQCGGRIETCPLSPQQKQNSELLQSRFCHAPDSELLEQIPVLSENDEKSLQRWLCIKLDLRTGLAPRHELATFFEPDDGLPKIVHKYGIFALIYFFSMTELEVLFLFLGLEGKLPLQAFFQLVMGISRSYVSTILNKFRRWRLIEAYTAGTLVQGRARGRQLVYSLTERTRNILEKDLQTYDFFHNAVAETISQTAEAFPQFHWRKEFLETTEQTVPPTPPKPTEETK